MSALPTMDDYTNLSHDHLVVGTVLPPTTVLVGTFIMTFRVTDSTPSSPPRLKFRLVWRVSKAQCTEINLVITPSLARWTSSESGAIRAEALQVMKKDHAYLESLLLEPGRARKRFRVDVSGMIVSSKLERQDGEGYAYTLEAKEARMVQESGQPPVVLLDFKQPLLPQQEAQSASPAKASPALHPNLAATDIASSSASTYTKHLSLSAIGQFHRTSSNGSSAHSRTGGTKRSASPTGVTDAGPARVDRASSSPAKRVRLSPARTMIHLERGEMPTSGAHVLEPKARASFLPESQSLGDLHHSESVPSETEPRAVIAESKVIDIASVDAQSAEQHVPGIKSVVDIPMVNEIPPSNSTPPGTSAPSSSKPLQVSASTANEPGPLSAPAGRSAPPAPVISPISLKRQRRQAAEAQARTVAEARRAEAEAARRAAEASEAVLARPLAIRPGDGRPGDPVTYVPIKSLPRYGKAGIICVLLEVSGVKRSAGADWKCDLLITDPSLCTSGTDAADREDMVVTVFRGSEAELPSRIEPGSVLLLRGVLVKPFNDKPKGQMFGLRPPSPPENTWAYLPPQAQTVQYACREHMSPPLGQEEVGRMRAMARWWAGTRGIEGEFRSRREVSAGGTAYDEHVSGTGAGAGEGPGTRGGRTSLAGSEADSTSGGRKGWITLGDVRDQDFFNAIFKILHVVHRPNAVPAMEVFITDGTVSPIPVRNYHNVSVPGMPPQSIFCLTVYKAPDAHVAPWFEPGKCMKMCNIRAKVYKGELELKWSEKLSREQVGAGWRMHEKLFPLGKDDEIARIIEKRIRLLKEGKSTDLADRSAAPLAAVPGVLPPAAEEQSHDRNPPAAPPQPPTPAKALPVAEHLCTTFTDPDAHPRTPLGEVGANATVPNRFRVLARVESIHSVGKKGGRLICKYCTHCNRAFGDQPCGSCHDVDYRNAELRYRFLILLARDPTPSTESDRGGPLPPTALPVLVSDDDATHFLPPLPPLKASTNPNDDKALRRRLEGIERQVQDILLGAKMDGERPRPLIDWTIESYHAKPPAAWGKGRAAAVKGAAGLRVFRVFGMRGR